MVSRPEEETIFEVVAAATVAGQDAAEAILKARGVKRDPIVMHLTRLGLASFTRHAEAYERLRLKVLRLDPDHYRRIAIRLKEREKTPAGIEAARRREARERESQERLSRAMGAAREAMDKIRIAMDFYEQWHLSDGTALGDATRKQLLAEAERESARADGHLRNVSFYKALARKMDAKQVVREAIPLDQAHRMREQAYGVAHEPRREAAE